MKLLLPLLLSFAFISTNVVAQQNNQSNLIAEVQVETISEFINKTPKKQSKIKMNNTENKTPVVSQNTQKGKSIKQSNHRSVIDRKKKIASRY